MTVDFWFGVVVAAGAVVGYGLYLLIIQFVPATPALGPALRRLHPTLGSDGEITASAPMSTDWLSSLRLPAADLSILGRTPGRHMLSVGLSALMAFLLPVLLTIVATLAGLSVPLFIPVAATVLLATAAALLAHFDMIAKARSARAEFARALCTYAALTAHQVRSGHGAVEAMERSASICDGWPYTRLRTALLTAQLQMRPPWDELKTLAEDIKVAELDSFADIMRSAGNDGAQVYQTLRAQSASLRDQIRVRALEDAKTRSSKLDIPSTLLIVILLVLVGYPLMANLLNQTY
ncbi:type II secretion system F family protein [Catellatospora tritici]|uniref:type II secretion system F family protein n=1 Tax=Catellatospora tritici TaxID=2851566 RepID=UPI001C2DAD01|nr:type II secretion system F family protein [Catellatospora tritici]MBV1851739.1 type II secretion system F family protein [Catellatospora tritici]